jgi:hypothetical protein
VERGIDNGGFLQPIYLFQILKQEPNIIHRLLPVAFALSLLLPWINLLTDWFPRQNTENRTPAAFPGLKTPIADVPGRFDTAFSDQFSMRSALMRVYGTANLNLFHKSPIPTMAYLGSDGWMYITRKELATFDGSMRFRQGELDSIGVKLLRRESYLRNRNCRFYLAIAPVKQSIYPEFQPGFIRSLEAPNRSDQLIHYLRKQTRIQVIDLRESLRIAKGSGQPRMFHKTDNHWNRYGAWLAAVSMAKRLNRDFPEISMEHLLKITIDSSSLVSGNIAGMMALSGIAREPDIIAVLGEHHVQDTTLFPWPVLPFANSWEYQIRKVNRIKNKPRILFIRDSFGSDVVPYLSEAFGETVALFDQWQYGMNLKQVHDFQPDAVILMVVESNLDHLLSQTQFSEF